MPCTPTFWWCGIMHRARSSYWRARSTGQSSMPATAPMSIPRKKGRLEGLTIAICGDVMHSRVARSNILLLNTMGARVRVVAPSTLLPRGIERMGVEVARDMREGLDGADIVMMLRLQRERMNGSFVPSSGE